MIEAVKDAWSYVLATGPSGQVFTIGQLVIVMLLLVF